MALVITQGPLPLDGAYVDPSVFIEDWINGTKVFNLGTQAFRGGTFQFVVSSTDAPASWTRFPGMLWFARGNGNLYIWDWPDMPSSLTFSDANWIALTRRELWCYVAEGTIPKGAAVKFYNTTDTNMTGFLTNNNQATRYDPYPRMLWVVEATQTAATNITTMALFVAMETATSGGLIRCWDSGFGDVLCGSGESGNSGAMCIDEQRAGLFWRIDETAGTRCRYVPHCETLDSSATSPSAEWLRPVFKHLAPLIGHSNTA